MSDYGTMASSPAVALPRTPQEMKKVLQDALSSSPKKTSRLIDFYERQGASSPTKSRLSHVETINNAPSTPTRLDFTPGFHPGTGQELRSDSVVSSSPYPPYSPVQFSPIRPLYTPPYEQGEEPRTTFEVDASFLQAMVTLLERQDMIVPDHLYTYQEVEEAVRKEVTMMKEQMDVPKAPMMTHARPWRPLSDYISLSDMLMTAVGVAGVVMFRRAALAHPSETAWYAAGAVKGGIYGLLASTALKGVLLFIETMRGS